MSSTEEYLKEHICKCCHAGICRPHPEEDKADQGYIKCPICGFTAIVKKKNEYTII